MATRKKFSKPVHAVVTVPDPENLDATSHVELGGRIEWRCETPAFPKFEIHFGATNPFNKTPNYILKGTIDKPVVRTAKILGDHEYHVTHIPLKGTPAVQSGPFNAQVTKCPHCPP